MNFVSPCTPIEFFFVSSWPVVKPDGLLIALNAVLVEPRK
jgi:hypothetical protein